MKLGKLLGRIGFVTGFVGPVLLYPLHVDIPYWASPLTPTCVLLPFARLSDWLAIGLRFGLLQGLTFALLGFAVGFSISKLARL